MNRSRLASRSTEGKGVILSWIVGLTVLFSGFFMSLATGSASEFDWNLVTQLRLPRAVLAAGAGLGLAVSGALLQTLFNNPLSDPYTLGVSSGAALFTVLAAAFGIHFSWLGFDGMALLGAALFSGFLMVLSGRGQASLLSILLFGMMLNFVGSSGVTLVSSIKRSEELQSATRWLFGDLSHAELSSSAAVVCLGLMSCIWAVYRSRLFDALLMGEVDATSLGVPVRRIRLEILAVVSALTAFGVSLCGMIGFLGLLVPHFVRGQVGALHYRLIPLSALWGAGLLVWADGLAKWVAAPYELPVGVVTTLVGAPMFIYILFSRRQQKMTGGQ